MYERSLHSHLVSYGLDSHFDFSYRIEVHSPYGFGLCLVLSIVDLDNSTLAGQVLKRPMLVVASEAK